jgi:glycosyltransferase involved in cell wall biosynthesis
MRIALIHYRLVRNGGLETRLFNYLAYFSAVGHEVTLVVSKVDEGILLPAGVKMRKVNLSRVPKPLRLYFFDKALKHIVIEGAFDFSFSLGRTSHQDMVLCPGNHLGYLRAMGQWWRSPVDLLNIAMDRWAYSGSRWILAASGMMRDELVELYGVPKEKIRVLHPPVNTAVFNPLGKEQKAFWREKYGFAKDQKSLLFLTTGNKRKGYPFLLQLMQELGNAPIELIVAGVKPMETGLPNVRYVGYAERPEELLWAADVLVHPALYEPFGQVVTEALQCGTPVLISDKVGAKEIIDPRVGRVLSGTNLEEWKNAVLEMTAHEWEIPSDVASQNGLTTAQHCNRILEIAAEVNIS